MECILLEAMELFRGPKAGALKLLVRPEAMAIALIMDMDIMAMGTTAITRVTSVPFRQHQLATCCSWAPLAQVR